MWQYAEGFEIKTVHSSMNFMAVQLPAIEKNSTHIDVSKSVSQWASLSVSQSVSVKDQLAALNPLSEMEMLMHGPVRRNTVWL